MAPQVDDPTIEDDAPLWRRVPPHHFVLDEQSGSVRPSSAAFEDHPDGSPMSVLLGAESAGPDSVLAGHPDFALASITAGLARECGQLVVRDPLPMEPAHALVIGRKTKGVRKRMAVAASWVVAPPDAVTEC
jgi:hypothetical protein